MSRKRSIAQLVTKKDHFERRQANLITRPLKIAFVIQSDLDLTHFAKVLEYNSAVWGGYYNCLVPTDGQAIEEHFWNDLYNHRPDKVVICTNKGDSDVYHTLEKEIQNKLHPFSIHYWRESGQKIYDIVEFQETGITDKIAASFPMTQVLRYELGNLRQPIEEGKSYIRIPKIDEKHPFYLCVIAQVGVAKGISLSAYKAFFKAAIVDFNSVDLDHYLDSLSECETYINPLALTGKHINTSVRLDRPGRPEGLSILLIGSDWIRDICQFWNFRLAPKFLGKSFKELLLPVDKLRSPKNLKLLAEKIQDSSAWHSHKISLYSGSMDIRRTRRLERRLKDYLKGDVSISVKKQCPNIAYYDFENTHENREIILEDNYFSLIPPRTVFGDKANGGEWSVDIKFDRPYEYPSFTKINDLLGGSHSFMWKERFGSYLLRYSNETITGRIHTTTKSLGVNLIKPTEAFQELFSDKGFENKTSEKHAYSEGLLSLLGSSDLLVEPNLRDLFWMMSNGDAYTFNGIKSCIKFGDESDAIIDSLVSKRLILRGMSFVCGSCGLSRWYPLNTLDERMQCVGCLEWISPPSNTRIVFRMNELASRAVNQGSIPVLLTEKVLSQIAFTRSLFLYGIEVSKGELNSDIDLISTHQGFLVLAECKEFKNGVSPNERKKTIKQLSNLVKVAKEVDAPIVLLSTLLPFDNPSTIELAERIHNINKKFKIAVHLLSLSEMKFVNLRNPNQTLEHPDLFTPIM